MKIKIINGANLNLLGKREISIYGNKTIQDLENMIAHFCINNKIDYDFMVSNYEGEVIEAIHDVFLDQYDALIINPGAFTHYSYAIRDALEIVKCLKVEVHISNIKEREAFRKESVIEDVCDYTIIGKGLDGYIEAIKYILEMRKR